ncbi:uncharacterized protein EURHEDRAFT_413981 [Aspergillus ruber CBS 135680]|uniref:Uncharacterized protein n=1 Tax=Aspergillus ruber (strain CBS 135680) TaxID=1388766 RepID=A0A017SBM2_ASPRC|nr:uncharacterized protein EURHEDRAFT_413981 [Aspergillus ruber CBS 135680]EYE93580.1 hypothetical protein EURHEDRAFT_413981 [Aspergillus ruber CBS 135680]
MRQYIRGKWEEMKHKTSSPMPSLTYSPLPPVYTTRMVRLLPHEDKNASIECEISIYGLSEAGGREHLYETLFYA